jgi:hypothetical protein
LLSLSLKDAHKELLLQKHQQKEFKGSKKVGENKGREKTTRKGVQRACGKASKIGKTYVGLWDNKA